MHYRSAGRKSFQTFNFLLRALLVTWAACCLLPTAFADTLIWNGGGATANWSDSGNWFGVIPASGDTLVFQGGQLKPVNTNDIVGLTINQIRFIGASGGYNIYGNAFTITNNIEATNSAGINVISNNITLGSTGDFVVDVGTGAKFTLGGTLSGNVGLIKNGGGTNLIAGGFDNVYTGTTTVNAGLMELFKNGVTAIPHNLIIGNGVSAATVRNLAVLEIADSANITIQFNGTWDLNNHSETVGPNLTISGAITTGSAATATLSPNANITVPSLANASISGNFNINSGTCTIQNDGYLDLQAVVSGSADIVKNGTGSTHLANANTFTGSFTANGENYVWITHPLGFGGTNGGTTLNDNTWLAIEGGITVTNEPLILNSTYFAPPYGAVANYNADTNGWTGPITFSVNASIAVVTNGSLTLSGPLSGPAGFTKSGPGVLTLAGPANSSSYFGDTTVNDGFLLLNSINVIRHGTLTIGDGICYSSTTAQPSDIVRYLTLGCIYGGPGGSKVVVKSTGWLDLNNFPDDVGPVEMDGGQITTGAGFFTLFQPFVTYKTDPTNGAPSFTGKLALEEDSTFGITNDLTMSANISDSFTDALIKTGPGIIYVSASNSYAGPTIIQQGIFYAQNSWAMGATTSGTVVSNRATLVLNGANLGFTNESLTLNGAGQSSLWGALDVETLVGTNFWAGPITVNADSTITAYYGGSVLQIPGTITGAGGVTTLPSGIGSIYFDGSVSNSYAGVTRVLGGTLLLDKIVTDGAIPGNVVVGSTLRLLANAQINNTADVLVQLGGLFDFGPYTDGIDTLHGNGSLTFATFGWLDIGENNGTSTFDGVMSGIGFPGGYTVGKQGTGTFTMNGNNTYQNRSDAYEGTLIINGSQPQSPSYVADIASLGGSGTVGDILCQGHLRPGNSPGILTCSNLTFTAGATYHEEISGRVPGTGYDQMNVRGTNNLANAALAISVPLSSGVSVGDQIVMINNDGVDPITGNFLGYGPGASYLANGFTFVISYAGGTGNDVVFTVTTIPGDVVSSSVTAGNGDHVIGPNECNNLTIVFTNKTGTPMTGITATLSTTNIGVEITQPYSSYADVPPNSKGTNIAPFQISTLPTFICGTDIGLQLTVHPTSHGAFTVPFLIHSGAPSNVPLRVDNGTTTSIPDVGSVDSTNTVSGFVGPLGKVVVALYLTHTFDSDLTNISLISPDNRTVLLSSANGGGGQNYGINCSPDAARTTFDDAALTSITSGSAPFAGTFRPQSPLSAFVNDPIPNGNWRLHIADGFGGSLGTLRCWSLFLYPITCAPGSGICDLCLAPISGSITTNDPVEITRVVRNNNGAGCGMLKPFPGTIDANLHYDAYTFTNTSGADACVTVELAATCDVQAIAYLGSFNPTNIANNYLADSGYSTSSAESATNAFSCNIPNGATFVVVVNEIDPNVGCNNYTLTLSGLPCPPPALAVEDVPTANAHLFWPNSAGGYLLESSPLAQPTSWSIVTNEPIILNGNYNVTNTATAPSQFYRLHKP